MKRHPTFGEKYEPAMLITDQKAADDYFEQIVTHSMKVHGLSRVQAEDLERQNLGYIAGYYGSPVRARVEALFKCAHPIFGTIAENGPPSPEAALAAGIIAAKQGMEMAAMPFAMFTGGAK